jgi:putative transposase
VRYVEQNPVAAGMVGAAGGWPWSSAASHLAGKRIAHDPLTDVGALRQHVRNWRAMLRHGLGAGELGPEGEAVPEAIEARLRTGRALADPEWITQQEERIGRPIAPRKPGRKPQGKEPNPR